MTPLESELREIARKFDLPALQSLAQGGRPGREWMLDNLKWFATARPNFEPEQRQRLVTWVKGLPSQWWDANFQAESPKKSDRPTALDILMDTAQLWAMRSTCARLHVGCVIAKDGRIIATGYNGAPAGVEHCNHDCTCTDGYPRELGTGEQAHRPGCPKVEPCRLAVHAEANAICFAAKHGLPLEGAVLYTTHEPCFNCSLLILSAGITDVIYNQKYRSTGGPELLEGNGVACDLLTPNRPAVIIGK
jgi:dCMP deaminase